MRFKTLSHAGMIAASLALWGSSFAGAEVSEQKALLLKSRLTPTGAERAGNADGSIPAWTGGYTQNAPGYHESDPRRDPFAAEKPLFSISAANYRDYAEKLPEGAKILFEKYPDY